MKTKILKIIAAPVLVAFVVLAGVGVLGIFSSTASAYVCHDSDYWDGTNCRAYKEVTANHDGNGNTICPSDSTKHDDGTCWAKGGGKKDYAPKNADGTDIDPSKVTCGTYHVKMDGDWPLTYDPDKWSCCANTGFWCTDPEIPEDPTQEKVDECTGAGATFDTNTHKCNWTFDTCTKAGGDFNDTTKECIKAKPEPKKCSDGSTPDKDGNCADGENVDYSGSLNTDTTNCGQANTVIVSCDSGSADCSGSSNNSADGEKGVKDGAPVIACVLRIGIQALTALIGIGAVGGIAWEALKYAKAGDNQSDTSEAKTRITEIVIGLVIYSFMLVAANWLIPGGII